MKNLYHYFFFICLLTIGISSMAFSDGPGQALSRDLQSNAWKIEITEPSSNSMVPANQPIETTVKLENTLYYPETISVHLQYEKPKGKWNNYWLFELNHTTNGLYKGQIILNVFNPGSPLPPSIWKHWRIVASASLDGNAYNYSGWRYFSIYHPDTVPDLYISSFESIPVLEGGLKRWHFTWTIRNKGGGIATASKLRISCHSVTDEPCVSGITGIYNIPQLWPKPNDPSGAVRVWNQPAVVVPYNAKYRFRAALDIGDNMDPNVSNNTMLTEFDAKATSTAITPKELTTRLAKPQANSDHELPVFGSKTAALGTVPKPISGPAPGGLSPDTKGISINNKPAPIKAKPGIGRLAQQPIVAPAKTGQALKKAPVMKPLSGPAPTLQPPPMTKAPPTAKPVVPMTRQRIDTASQKAPIITEQPGIKRQVMLAQPLITYPKKNTIFTTPASFNVNAKLVSGKKLKYALRKPGQFDDYLKNNTGHFSNINPGKYCIYVAYEPGGPASECVPFSVRLAMKKAPVMRTAPKPVTQPAPTIAPKPVSPAPIKKTKPMPVTPSG